MKRDRDPRSHTDIQECVRQAETQRRDYLRGLFRSAVEGIVRGMASLGLRSQERRPLAAG